MGKAAWVVLASLGLALSACSDAETDSAPSDTAVPMVPANATPLTQESADMSGNDFASALAVDQIFEVEISKLALRKSLSAEIRKYAQSMIDSQAQASAKLRNIAVASAPPIILPARIYSAQQIKLDTLANGGPETFDRFYMLHQMETQSTMLALLEGYAANGRDPALKQLASGLMPQVAAHLDAARRMNSPAG